MSIFRERLPRPKPIILSEVEEMDPRIPFHADARRTHMLRQIGEGGETRVFHIHSIQKDRPTERPRGMVMKNYFKGEYAADGSIRGFGADMKQRLEAQMDILTREYGAIIPPYRIIPHPAEPERFLLAQAFVDGKSVYNYSSFEKLNEDGRDRLQQFVSALKRNFLLGYDKKPFALPDLLPQNVRLDAMQRAYYIDSGVYTDVADIDFKFYAVQIASLELLAGGNGVEMRQDPVYKDFFKEEEKSFSSNEFSNPKQLYTVLRTYYKLKIHCYGTTLNER